MVVSMGCTPLRLRLFWQTGTTVCTDQPYTGHLFQEGGKDITV